MRRILLAAAVALAPLAAHAQISPAWINGYKPQATEWNTLFNNALDARRLGVAGGVADLDGAGALPAARLGNMPTTTFLLPGAATALSLTQMLSPPLTIAEFGAAGHTCTGDGTDMSPAFQAMFNAAALSGQPMTYSGKCYLGETITLGAAPGGMISLGPVGEGELDTNGQDVIKAVPPQGVAGSVVYKFDLQRNEVHSLASTANTGRLLYVDCTTYGNFCTKNRSDLSLNHLYNMAGIFYGSEVQGFSIDRNVSDHAVATGSENFIEVHGDVTNSVQACSAGVYTYGNTVTGGTFEYNNGCVQGFKNEANNQLLGFFGVFDANPVSVQDVVNRGNYFEDGADGIYEPAIDGATDTDNHFDPNPASNGGMNANWHAIVIGDPGTGAPAQAATVSDNNVFNFSAQVVNTPIVVNAGNGSAVIGNHVTGLISTADCMQVGTTTGTGYAAPVLIMEGNTCWGAGAMVAIGSSLSASRNYYTLSSNYALPILFEAGAIAPSAISTGNVATTTATIGGEEITGQVDLHLGTDGLDYAHRDYVFASTGTVGGGSEAHLGLRDRFQGFLTDYSAVRPTFATGGSYTIPDNSKGAWLACGGGTLATGTVNLPANPLDQDEVQLGAECTITSLTVGAASSSSGTAHYVSTPPTTISSGTPYRFIFFAAVNTWDQAR